MELRFHSSHSDYDYYGIKQKTTDERTGPSALTTCPPNRGRLKVVWNSSSQIWCELHEEAFAYFGGAARLIRLDNLREGVIDPDIYDPELNGLYAAMLAHYSVVAIPCRPYAPDLKGKVESAVGHTQG